MSLIKLVTAPPPPWPKNALKTMTDAQLNAAEILTEGARHAVAHIMAQQMNERVARAMLTQLRKHAAALADEQMRRSLTSLIAPHEPRLH